MKKKLIIIPLAVLALVGCKKKIDELPAAEPAVLQVTQIDDNSFVFKNATPTGGGATYWDFGGLSTSFKQTDTAFFGAIGTYDVHLTTNSKGGVSKASTKVTITKASPLSEFTVRKLDEWRHEVIAITPDNISYNYSYSNGEKVSAAKDTVYFPWTGTHTITLTVRGKYNGRTVTSISKQQVNVASDDQDNPLLTDTVFNRLTGGKDDTDGKTWVLSPAPNISGHGAYKKDEWDLAYNRYPNGLSGDPVFTNGALQNEYTFVAKNYQYIPKNNMVSAHFAYANADFGKSQPDWNDIALTDPNHKAAPFILKNEGVGKTGYTLKIANGSYIGWYDRRYDYEIFKITEDSLWLRHKYSDDPKSDPKDDTNMKGFVFIRK